MYADIDIIASGIGRAIALSYVKAGVSKIALIDINSDGLYEVAAKASEIAPHHEFQTLVRVVDVSDEAAVDSVINDTVSQFGRLDCAVNCAGVNCTSSLLATTTTSEFDRTNQINYRGVFFALRAQLRVMAAQEPRDEERGERGSIVNISSVGGVLSCPGHVAYGASKHAVIGMTKTAAMDYGKDRIRVNAVCPGFIETPLTEQILANEQLKKFACSVALRRVAVPEEVADPVLFLTSPAASFITGASLMIDGGYTISK
ncbi:hypothetical protein BDD12DRAFT_823460 [Trichophaea hybrida]|nr:hypothetical protein BDD12DRAFT_823460 [Trichophaea hybrida]